MQRNSQTKLFDYEILAKGWSTFQLYGDQLVKPSILACACKVLGKDAASALMKMSFFWTQSQEDKRK